MPWDRPKGMNQIPRLLSNRWAHVDFEEGDYDKQTNLKGNSKGVLIEARK